ncbi:DUF6801 domain-containing protein [Streptomyces sp. SPB162]|uniref:DUF6801 domain-containing protein n=1 Tax=Streptomyces sp. SPB162 TaxID=2940560 RepID=UPI0024057066|nr:DUF6801 domain-containing protein [Streptomyces sp. SPB162]MDF9814524.1 hypothetical protein [Streptomyces sp. SPB162]
MRGAQVPRRTVRLAAIAAAALLAGLLPGAGSAAAGRDGPLAMAYTCAFPGGDQAVHVSLVQSFPETGAVDKPIQPGDLTMAVTLPRAAVDGLVSDAAGTLAGAGSLTARVTQGTSAADAPWPGLRAPAVPVAGKDDLVLTFKGEVPSVTVTAAGEVGFGAGDLALELTVGKAAAAVGTPAAATPAGTTPAATAPTPATSAVPATSAPAKVACSPAAGQNAVLGAVPVAVPDPTPSGTPSPSTSTSGSPSATPSTPGGPSAAPSGPAKVAPGAPHNSTIKVEPPVHSGKYDCGGVLPKGKLDFDHLPLADEKAADATVTETDFDLGSCAYAVGYSNVHKLDGAALINDPRGARGPSLTYINMNVRMAVQPNPPQYYEFDSLGSMTLPVADSTFLTYGFMPTTAKMAFTPDPKKPLLTIVTTGTNFVEQNVITTIHGYQWIRLYDVKINGTPLDVGPNCRTRAPIELALVGLQDAHMPGGGDGKPDYTILDGGPLHQENLTIPAFTGCGTHGEKLDALFTSAVSGPGNSLNLNQGTLCAPWAGLGCDAAAGTEIQIPPLPHR